MQGLIVPDELITADNVSKELLQSIFDAAFMETSIDGDGDLVVKNDFWTFVLPYKEARYINILTFFDFKPEATMSQRLDCANNINKDFVIARAAVMSNGKLFLSYDFSLDGGLSKKYFVLTVK